MNDKELKACVHRAQRGSAGDFGELYAFYAADLYRFALWYLKNEDDAADAVQDACLQAYRNIRALKNAAAFKSWFFKILSNVCKDALRRQNRLSVVPLDDARVSLDVPVFDPDGGAEALLEQLSDLDRQIVAMAVLGDFTGKEIGAALGLKPGTVRSRLSRALAYLREHTAV